MTRYDAWEQGELGQAGTAEDDAAVAEARVDQFTAALRRLREDPTEAARVERIIVAVDGSAATPRTPDAVEPGRSEAHPLDRMIIAADIERFGARNSRLQHEARAALVHAMDEAAAAAGIDRQRWLLQPTGDGELAVLPADLGVAMVGVFPRELDAYLRRHNAEVVPEARLRVRIAIDYGAVAADGGGFHGASVVRAARLVDTPAVRSALEAAPNATTAYIVSDRVYRDIVAAGHSEVRPEQFAQVVFNAKGSTDSAWIRVVGADTVSISQVPGLPKSTNARESLQELAELLRAMADHARYTDARALAERAELWSRRVSRVLDQFVAEDEMPVQDGPVSRANIVEI
jgi:hypothetical protein